MGLFFLPSFLEKDESWPTEPFLLKTSLEITCSLEGKRGGGGGGLFFFFFGGFVLFVSPPK